MWLSLKCLSNNMTMAEIDLMIISLCLFTSTPSCKESTCDVLCCVWHSVVCCYHREIARSHQLSGTDTNTLKKQISTRAHCQGWSVFSWFSRIENTQWSARNPHTSAVAKVTNAVLSLRHDTRLRFYHAVEAGADNRRRFVPRICAHQLFVNERCENVNANALV